MPEPKPSNSPILWPAEWSRDEKFWREVGTRTLAGVLTLVIIGVPALVAAAITKTIDSQTILSIVIGMGISLVVIIVYIIVYRLATREPAKAYDANSDKIESLYEMLRTVEAENAGRESARAAKKLREDIETLETDERKTQRVLFWRAILSAATATVAGAIVSVLASLLT